MPTALFQKYSSHPESWLPLDLYTEIYPLFSPVGTTHNLARGFNLWSIVDDKFQQSPIGTDDINSIARHQILIY
jgi:hypothetical protein